MNVEKRSALIVGATGLVGNELLQLLLESDEYEKVKVLVRTPISIDHPKLTQCLVNFDELNNYEDEFAVNDVFCCLGTTIKKAGSQEAFRKVDFEYPLQAGKLAAKQGVRQYLIVSAIGADPQSSIFYSRVKGDVEAALSQLQLPSLHIFRPSLILGKRNEFRFGEKVSAVLSPVFSPLFVGKLNQYKPIQARKIAEAMYRTAIRSRTGEHIYKWEQMTSL